MIAQEKFLTRSARDQRAKELRRAGARCSCWDADGVYVLDVFDSVIPPDNNYDHYHYTSVPKGRAGKKELRAMLESLQAARKAATFETASFTHDAENQKIKDVTKLYRDSWILGPLDAVINRIQKILGE